MEVSSDESFKKTIPLNAIYLEEWLEEVISKESINRFDYDKFAEIRIRLKQTQKYNLIKIMEVPLEESYEKAVSLNAN
ncbi:4674_t:CDS:1, partial [Scutellospora calospora]